MKKLIILLIFISSSCLLASGFSSRKKSKKKSSKTSFRQRLRKKIMHKNKLNYKQARRLLFGKIHLENASRNPSITDIYCYQSYSNKDIRSRFKIGKGKIPDHTVLNAEHVWPKSKFFAKKIKGKYKRHAKPEYQTRYADLHILYPSSSKLNKARSNYKFGEVLDRDKQTKNYKCSTAQLGHIDVNGKSSRDIFFEPPPQSKGNVARAMFYFSIRYNREISHIEEDTLRKWHELDPPDGSEKKRNDFIEEAQGNRNPFIDDPKLVEEIADF